MMIKEIKMIRRKIKLLQKCSWEELTRVEAATTHQGHSALQAISKKNKFPCDELPLPRH